MVKNGDADKPIWAMEVGWNALPGIFTEAPFGRVTEAQQAQYAVQAYRRAQDEWPWMGAMAYWFFKRADDSETNQPFYYFRLFDPDFTPLPVYTALKDYIASARFLGVGFHEANHWALDYQGAWQSRTSDCGTTGTCQFGQLGDSLRFTFHGTDLELAVAQNPYGGIVEVSVDGGAAEEIDLRATDPESGGRIVLAHALADGEHRAAITVERGELLLDGVIVRRTNAWLIERAGWIAAGSIAAAVGWVMLR